jgi:hypothetical protein
MMLTRRTALVAPVAAAASLAIAPSLTAATSRKGKGAQWSAAWGRALVRDAEPLVCPSGSSYVQSVSPSLSGTGIRVTLCNTYGASTLFIARASARLADGTNVPLRFAGQEGAVIPAGARIVSDAAPARVTHSAPVELAFQFDRDSSLASVERTGKPEGASVRAASGQSTSVAPHLVATLDVSGAGGKPVLAILSDTKSAAQETWPTAFARLAGGKIGIVNRSVFAGHLALGPAEASGIARLDRDIMATSGITHALIFNGNNDLIQPGMISGTGRLSMDPALALTAQQLIGLLAQAAQRVRDAGIKAVGGTWLPYEGVTMAQNYSTPDKLAKREQINEWIRTSGAFDMVIDFDRALAEPANRARLAAKYDSGNRFTPNDAGYELMAATAVKALLG